jgi:hypothetical protein
MNNLAQQGIKQVLSAPRAPWQRAYVERVIGTIRRECLDHLIVFNEACLYRHLQAFCSYYYRTRTHLALQKDSPEPRPVQTPDARLAVGGRLHHRRTEPVHCTTVIRRRAPPMTTQVFLIAVRRRCHPAGTPIKFKRTTMCARLR